VDGTSARDLRGQFDMGDEARSSPASASRDRRGHRDSLTTTWLAKHA